MAIQCIGNDVLSCNCPKCNPDYWCIEGELLLDKNAALLARLSNAESVVEAAEDILANGYDQGRRITLRASLLKWKEK